MMIHLLETIIIIFKDYLHIPIRKKTNSDLYIYIYIYEYMYIYIYVSIYTFIYIYIFILEYRSLLSRILALRLRCGVGRRTALMSYAAILLTKKNNQNVLIRFKISKII